MGILRNSIDITGISLEGELPRQIRGDFSEAYDTSYLFIPGNRPRPRAISEISMSVELKEEKIINSPAGKIAILDGVKNIKVTYLPVGHSRRRINVLLALPFNTSVKLPESATDIEDINIYIADAYFQLVEGRKIYSYIYYILDVDYPHKPLPIEVEEEETELHDTDIIDEREILNIEFPDMDIIEDKGSPDEELPEKTHPYPSDDSEDGDDGLE
ncbi:MAG: hypothetical protein Q8930_20170 [Bacillota bacterium]|nr:hypothetical protein [Bacillota bacterium]